MARSFQNRSVDANQFAMITRAEVPRSTFAAEWSRKATFNPDLLYPILVEEVLPGDSIRCSMTAFTRVMTPLYPFMDSLHMDSYFFFVPYRLVWDNFVKMMGEQKKPTDSIDYLIPQRNSPVGGYELGSLHDHMGLPVKQAGTVDATGIVTHSVLPLRAYNLIYNEWFRDQNLIDSVEVPTGDGPDASPLGTYQLLRRAKRPDYFTTCLPWPQKGQAPMIPVMKFNADGSLAAVNQTPVIGIGVNTGATGVPLQNQGNRETTGNIRTYPYSYDTAVTANALRVEVTGSSASTAYPGIYATLTQVGMHVNTMRQAFAIQRLLEKDARGGTRYTEILTQHFGVNSPDMRLQRPEYLGGGSTVVSTQPVAQTSATVTGQTPLGALGATASATGRHGFSQSFNEHGVIIGIVSVRADITYQQGLHRMWTRKSRYDFYWPSFAHLGEQAVTRSEIYHTGLSANDTVVFGYQERWSEYRYKQSSTHGYFRSGITGSLDGWHLAERFATAPVLGPTFIESQVPLERILAGGTQVSGFNFLTDFYFQMRSTRCMPAFSTPGLVDHF